MTAWFRRPRVRHFATWLFLLLTPLACHSWRASEKPIPDTLAAEPAAQYRVVLASGARVEVLRPAVVGDSLIGTYAKSRAGRFAAPVSEVVQVEVLRPDTGKTILLAAGVIGIVVLAIASVYALEHAMEEELSEEIKESGSCPTVYSWDGANWRLDSGTFSGAITQGAQRTELDNLDHLAVRDGMARLQVRNELPETDYIDALAVLAVDHPEGTMVAPDDAGRLHTLRAPAPPLAARDYRGRDVLPQVGTLDGRMWESVLTGRDSSSAADTRDGVELSFAMPRGRSEARLVLEARNTVWALHLQREYLRLHGPGLQAWYDSLDASPPMVERIFGRLAAEAFLQVQVDSVGIWVPRGMVWEIGPEASKRVVVPLRLAGIAGETLRLRLESAPALWHLDYVALDTSEPGELRVARLALKGDDAAAVAGVDRRYLTLESGDLVEFRVTAPAPRPGMMRSYLLESNGWYRLALRPAATADQVLLARFDREPGFGGRMSVAWLNQALAVMARGAER